MSIAQQRYNLTVRSIETTRFHNPEEFSRFLVDMTLIWAAPAALMTASGAAANALYGSKPSKSGKDLALEGAGEVVSEALDTIPFIREASGFFQGRHDAQPPAGLSAVADVYRGLDQMAQGEVDLAALKAWNTVAGDFIGYPAGQLNKMAQGWSDVVDNKAGIPAAVLGSPQP
jgi:hypothetical protein